MTAEERPWHVALRPSALDSPGMAPTFKIDALKKLWARDDRPHVYGLFGPAGCGKTTTARILGEMIRQEFALEQDDADAMIQIHEVNVADDNGVQFARALVERMLLRSPRPVVWILDEVHQLTTAAQNVLLKTLEEPPKFAYFFLATTDAQKLLKAVSSRCHIIQFHPLLRPAWYTWARVICGHTGSSVPSTQVLGDMWERAAGAPRKLIQMLQTYAATGELQDADDVEGDVSVPQIAKTILYHAKISEVLALLKSGTWDPERLRRGVMGYLSAVLLGAKSANDLFRAHRALRPFTQGPMFFDRAAFLVALIDAWETTKESA